MRGFNRLLGWLLVSVCLASSARAAQVATGSYVGNAADNRSIAVGFAPDVVFVSNEFGGADNRETVLRTTAMAGDLSCELTTKCDINRIQALHASGFEIGTDQAVNKAGRIYHYVALKSDDCTADVAVGSYLGNGADNRPIAGAGFPPSYVLVKRADTATAAMQRFGAEIGDASLPVNSGSSEVTNRIQAFLAAGFEIGNNAAINASSDTFYWVAWRAGSSASYVGNGVNGRLISGLGFTPAWVLVRGTGARQSVHRPASIAGGVDSTLFLAGQNAAPDRIEGLTASGFTIGTHDQVNQSGVTYFFTALQSTPSSCPTATSTASATGTATRTATATSTPQHTATATATVSATATATPVDTDTPTPLDTSTPTPIDTHTPTPADTATPTPADTHTATATETPTATSTPEDTATATATATETATPTPVDTDTPTPVDTDTPTPVDTDTPTPIDTDTPTATEPPTATPTPEDTATPVDTDTPTESPTHTPTVTPTASPTPTRTATFTRTATPTPVLSFLTVYRDGTNGIDGLFGPTSLAISPDGTQLYATGSTDNVLVMFDRNTATGSLGFSDNIGIGGASFANHNDVAVSPDNTYIYATSLADSRLRVFRRGLLGLSIVQTLSDSTTTPLGWAADAVLSPDGAHLYVPAWADNVVTVWSRNAANGSLSFVGSNPISAPNAVVVSPDGAHVYVTAEINDEIAVYARNATTGQLTLIERQRDGIGGVNGLAAAEEIAISGDGLNVYATGPDDNALAVFARNSTTGRLTFLEFKGLGGSFSAFGVAVSPNGAWVVATIREDDNLVVYSRDVATGHLTARQGLIDGVGGVDGLDDPREVTVSPDGTSVYVAARGDNSVALFRFSTP